MMLVNIFLCLEFNSFTAEMHSCADLYKSGTRNNGIYTIFNGKGSFEVYCDFES